MIGRHTKNILKLYKTFSIVKKHWYYFYNYIITHYIFVNDLEYNVTEKTEGLRKCTGKQSNRDESNEACMFDLDEFKREGCGPPHFGFDEGKPCVVLTLNKVYYAFY